jgi:hypothetical protein
MEPKKTDGRVSPAGAFASNLGWSRPRPIFSWAAHAGALALVATLALAASGCTSMGWDNVALRDTYNFGPPEKVRMCVYLDDGVTRQDASTLLDSWNEEGSIYNLYIDPVSFKHMSRIGFFHNEILAQVDSIPLGPTCDRVIYFVNRNAGDVLYGLAAINLGLPEVLGEVDDATLTHGFVVARLATLNQLVMTPSDVTQHELFHMMGCPEHFDMADCYRRIHDLKLAEAKLNASGYFAKVDERPFYPTYASGSDGMLVSREQVDDYAMRMPGLAFSEPKQKQDWNQVASNDLDSH